MSYQVLARKYRPKSFETLVGQEHVVRALTHALEQQRLHHAYLFTGTRGVGKTTLSRILAKSFNCEKGITAQPCGVCDACSSIDAGRFVDYIEMDAASNRGVDEMAALLEQAIYAPSNARFKVYMIDEVHMLTNHAFNSMLKTLEEPPEHVKFILATTDPQKIPVTVLSRCLQFNLKQMPPGHIVGHLENILGQEHIDFELAALRLLAQGAHGSMRDALSLTDQAIAYAAGKVSLDAVQSMLGALDQSYLIRLLDALVQEDGAGLLAVADEMAARSLSYKSALQDLGTMLHQVAVAQMVPAALAEDLPERNELLRLAQSFNKEEVQLFYQIAVHGRNEIGLAPDEYAGFSMTLLRMLAFRPASLSVKTNSATSVGGPGINNVGNVNGGVSRGVSAPVARPAPATQSVVSSASRAMQDMRDMPERATNSVASTVSNASVSDVSNAATERSNSQNQAEVMPAATAMPEAPAVKPMSPAMAALAAARAASGQKQNAQGANRAAAPSPVVAVVTPTVIAKPIESVDSGGLVQSSKPVEAIAMNTVENHVQSAPPSPAKPLSHSTSVASTPTYGGTSEMPPPWDDIEFDQSVASIPVGRHKEIQETDYWADDNSGELVSKADTVPTVAQVSTTVTEPEPEPEPASMSVMMPQVDSRPNAEESAAPVTQSGFTESAPESSVVVSQPLQLSPVDEIKWDGHWPNLASSLSVRGVAQQLAQQSELRSVQLNGNAIQFKLCVPLQTLLSAGSGEKLTAALNERFAEFGKEIRVDFEIGAVEQTANAQAVAERAERQVQAEQAIQSDSFVQTLMREFGASILTGSIRPI
ncbi:DNA polymerase III subunit gamma/tau [Undibacterium danionis]|uniref:DNA-directed DNA polymerase n=1 Tax=Undibacterium danionis TaxID=1812100 RepID=A0ABV6IGM2_9BURK